MLRKRKLFEGLRTSNIQSFAGALQRKFANWEGSWAFMQPILSSKISITVNCFVAKIMCFQPRCSHTTIVLAGDFRNCGEPDERITGSKNLAQPELSSARQEEDPG